MDEGARRGPSYADAGVDVEAGDALVGRIAPAAKATARAGSMGGLGGFGALFDLRAAGYADPVLVAATDGVGTKLRIAIETGRLGTVGQDLVAMCVNDLVCQGAEPLFFLDYYASGRLVPEDAAEVIEGIARACKEAGCALIGGETAEMPGMYHGRDFDLAGFAVGAVERVAILPAGVAEGDAILGLAASGLHSNGFSLIRRLVADAGLGWDDPAPWAPERPLGEALLEPTRLYVRGVLATMRAGGVRALAHVTGGGLPGNLPRVLPEGLGAALDAGAWERPAIYGWISGQGVEEAEMARAFNLGIGMALVCAPGAEAAVTAALEAEGERAVRIGTVTQGAGLRWIER